MKKMMIKTLEERIEALEQRVKELEILLWLRSVGSTDDTSGPSGVPMQPLDIKIPNIWINECPKCGLSLGSMMHYVCVDPQCPCGFGPVINDIREIQ